MNSLIATLFAVLGLSISLCASAQQVTDPLTRWAYPWVNPSPAQAPKSSSDPGTTMHVPESNLTYSRKDTRDFFIAPDWHPDDHPAMPPIVKRGRKPNVYACGFCHRADGPGGPENASLAGLPIEYIIQQVADFKSGARKSVVSPDVGPNKFMRTVAESATDPEIKAAAAYFASIRPRPSISVVETVMVPKTFMTGYFFADFKTGEQEPLGDRIIEIPNDVQQFENRDTRTRFTAFVPVGSVKKGEFLASGQSPEKTMRCEICHGPGLKGNGLVPRIAGRSPSYIARQLYDIQHGGRNGATTAPMLVIVEKLSTDDMLVLAAYVASLPP